MKTIYFKNGSTGAIIQNKTKPKRGQRAKIYPDPDGHTNVKQMVEEVLNSPDMYSH